MKRIILISLILCAGIVFGQTITNRTKTTTAGGDSTMFIVDRGNSGTILTRRWHWLDMMTTAAGNGLARSGNTLAINPGLGTYLETDAIHVWTDTTYSTHIIGNRVGVVLKSTGGLTHSADGLGVKITSGGALIVDGGYLKVYPDPVGGLEIPGSMLRVKTAPDSAMGKTATGGLYPVIDHDRGLFYTGGAIALYIDTGRNLSFGADGKVGLSPRFEIYGDSLYFEVSTGVYKAIKLNASGGPY